MPDEQGLWRPGWEDLRGVVENQNPWHASGVVPGSLKQSVERPLAASLWRRLLDADLLRYQLVLGPRRVGKTTSLYQTVDRLLRHGVRPSRIWWFRLDHPLLMRTRLGSLVKGVVDAAAATPADPLYIVLDELTYADDWDRWLKTFYDERWPVRIAASSSSTFDLSERRLETGVGRWDEQYLAPYLFPEFLSLLGRGSTPVAHATLGDTIAAMVGTPALEPEPLAPRLSRFLLMGGFPELILAATHQSDQDAALTSQRILRADAIERAIYKDIPLAVEVRSPALLERMLYMLAAQMTGLLSPQRLCKELEGMSLSTFDRYLSYLERSLLVFTLPNYSPSESSVQRRGKKLYFVDGAVRNAALQRGIAPFSDPVETGMMLENAAASHMHALSKQSAVRLYHWRERDVEVDLVYDDPARPLAFEIATSAQHHRKGLRDLMDRHPKFVGGCYVVSVNAPRIAPDAAPDRIGSIPLDHFLVAIGVQARHELDRRLGVDTDPAP